MATFVSNDYFIPKGNQSKSTDDDSKKPIQIPELKVTGISNVKFQKSPKSPSFSSSVFKDLPVEAVNYNDIPQFSNNIIIDVRSFNHYITSRIKNSINICLPSTLLKRPSYNLPQILNSIKIDQITKDILLDQSVNLLFYDDNSSENQISFQLFQTITKFLNYNKNFSIYYLNHGFNINKIDSNLIDHQLSPISPVSNQNGKFPDFNLSFHSKSENSLPSLLSGFQLPSSSTSSQKFLSSMKNVPKLNLENVRSDLHNYNYEFKFMKLPLTDEKLSNLPIWLKQLFLKDDKLKSANEILQLLNVKFNKIEYNEQMRLKLAINDQLTCNCNCTPSTLCPSCDGINYKIPKGIEYGLKNRYKNIFPFEHSRVRLRNDNSPMDHTPIEYPEKHNDYLSCNHFPSDEDDYFNGNFIEYNKISNCKYIATQNPLSSTYYDFWKMVWHHTNLIVCLNNQNDFTQIKYFDNQKLKDISIELQEIQRFDNFNLRILKLSRKHNFKLIYHLEYKDWPDFGVPNINSILSFIKFKNNLMKQFNLNKSSLVHCSAGCGRTGCFITIDLIIDLFNNHSSDKFDPLGEIDLVYKSIQFQRSQRVSMVQNFDQYIVCYDTILNYLMTND